MRIRLLGDLEVISPERQPVRFATRKSLLLFAALVLAGRRGHRREQLAEAFWPGRSEAQARNNLRQALVDIRRSFPTGNDSSIYVEGDQDAISLIAGPDDVDIWVFDRKVDGGQTADQRIEMSEATPTPQGVSPKHEEIDTDRFTDKNEKFTSHRALKMGHRRFAERRWKGTGRESKKNRSRD